MNSRFFSSLLPDLSIRAARATISRLGFSNPPLRRHLFEVFARGYGEPGCFLGDPVFEATYGWKQADATMAELAKTLLDPNLVNAMDKPWGESGKDYQFPKTAKPYTHQLKAWRALLGPGYQSVVVTSGTGSGKTECFMVPVLHSVLRAHTQDPESGGVRALFLYPLNALIQSQRERLRAWTGPFDGDVRFCLYNGMTLEEAKSDKYREAPNEVHDRVGLRANPPAILVTNPTMLEYMLVRAQDAPIIEKSRGKLEWIVLDEAHNYVGSQAAELALLLRRVLHAFGTSAERVRFVATSATIGSGDSAAKAQLQEFLAQLAGVNSDRVMVVEGDRHIPEITETINVNGASESAGSIAALEDAEGRYQRLSVHPVARNIRSMFLPSMSGQSFQTLSALKESLRMANVPCSDEETLKWLDLLTSGVKGRERTAIPFLPLRLHAFHNTLNGLWACGDPACSVKHSTKLSHPDWLFGMVYMEARKRCACGAPVYPLTSCNDCNETYLRAEITSSGGSRKLLSPTSEEIDEFTLDRDPEERDVDVDGEAEEERQNYGSRTPALIVNGSTRGKPRSVNRENLELLSKPIDGALSLRVQDVEIVDHQRVLKCPSCDGDEHLTVQFRAPILGAPFLLGSIIPTLLEYCPDGNHPLALPMRGRRMITFTDSRQGTARIAAQLQQDAERNALRAAVYRRLVSATSTAGGERSDIENQIAAYRKVLDIFSGKPESLKFEQLIKSDEEKLRKLAAGKIVHQQEMVEWLASQAQDIERWVHEYYVDSDSLFKEGRGKSILAEILLCREFARRPKRQNSLETMGLVSVQYPKLARVTTRRSAVEQAGLSLAEWLDFLKICLDFFVRQRFCLNLPPSWERWGGNRVFAKNVLPPISDERSTSKLTRWPKVLVGKRQNGLVRLLAYAMSVDPGTSTGRDKIDSLLLAAWEDLVSCGLLQMSGGQGRYLALEDMAFQTITKAWVCPVTRRILDTTLRGVTPYLPAKQRHEGVAVCRPIEMPVCDVIARDYLNDDARIEAARVWVDSQVSITEARVEGLWSNISDRVIEGAGYFRSVEHSAQQPGSRLAHYESQFKRGEINVMSCSTTMEMGVDIGGINTVAMNNVPPHPANYLQRAGRAGRRAETRSVALTVCKNNPHDQHVLRNTTWPFVTRLRTPSISLSSPLIVQRHINALLLSRFLKLQDRQGKLDKLTLDWWMTPLGSSRQERFVAWCDCFDADKQDDLKAGLAELIKRTVFEGRASLTGLISDVGNASSTHAKEWRKELDAIDEQIAQLSKKDSEARMPLRALQIQRSRLTGEYLLRELATSGFLPGYGFPTDITTFETLNQDSAELKWHKEKASEGREDNRFQRRELPSRDTVTALREYAPGANVVIDGLVYESAGITLNWHAPASLDKVNEIQNIRQAWRCGHCGSSGTHGLAAMLSNCPECGTKLGRDAAKAKQYIEPAGFSVDLYAKTHNDISQQKYVPVEPPWITSSGDWMALANPLLGRFRSSSTGSIFHYSSGLGSSGYAVCLECGRAAPMGYTEDVDELPRIFQKPHKRLRGKQGGGDWTCGGSESAFKIKKAVSFGREYTTDVLELTLIGTDGHSLVDLTVAYTLAVALRRAIADYLGVDETELGCDTKPIRDAQGRQTRVLQIYDVRSAGYASLVSPVLPQLLSAARKILECESECDSSCQSCLLTFDTRFRVDQLDRNAALLFLTEDWINSLALPEEEQIFGKSSQAEYLSIDEAISRELNRPGASCLYVYLNGDSSEWDLATSPIRKLLHRLSAKEDVNLSLVTAEGDLTKLSRENVAILSGLEHACRVALRVGRPPALLRSGQCFATVEMQGGICTTWASRDPGCTLPAATWGHHDEGLIVVSSTGRPLLASEPVRLPQQADPSVRSVAITHELDGAGAGFGQRFWSLLKSGAPAGIFPSGSSVVSVNYEDRYLATPVACAILVEVVSSLKGMCEATDSWGDVNVTVKTMFMEDDKPSRYRDQWTSNWAGSRLRDEALRVSLDYCGMMAIIESRPRNEVSHGRRLRIAFSCGSQLAIWLDQGFSYWSMNRHEVRSQQVVFPMNDSAQEIGIRLAQIKIQIEGHDMSTQVFVDSKSGRMD